MHILSHTRESTSAILSKMQQHVNAVQVCLTDHNCYVRKPPRVKTTKNVGIDVNASPMYTPAPNSKRPESRLVNQWLLLVLDRAHSINFSNFHQVKGMSGSHSKIQHTRTTVVSPWRTLDKVMMPCSV